MIASLPWGLSAADERSLLRRLAFRHFKWDLYGGGRRLVLPEWMVIDEAEHLEVIRIVEGLQAALTRLERRIAADPAVLRRLGIAEPLWPLVVPEPAPRLQCARYDLFPTVDGGWKVSEFNEDVPGGFNESVGLPELMGDPGGGLRWGGDLRAPFLEALRGYRRIALLYATAFAEDLQHVLELRSWLEGAGHETVMASPEHMRRSWRGPRFLGQRVDAAFRFFPGEWMERLDNLSEWSRLGGRFPIMNPFRHLVRQSKAIFAVWREDPLVSGEDRALVERHCPWTGSLEEIGLERITEERERWVLKGSFGRMGDTVVIGALVTQREWEAALAEPRRAPAGFCIQERFDTRAVDFAEGPLFPSIGAYVVNGRFAGYYSRAAPLPFITHEAYHVATLVRAA